VHTSEILLKLWSPPPKFAVSNKSMLDSHCKEYSSRVLFREYAIVVSQRATSIQQRNPVVLLDIVYLVEESDLGEEE
jgi:hypothetical protein